VSDLPALETLFEALEATWPPAATSHAGPWVLRDGQGGGKRVSAATTLDEDADLAQMEAAQAALGQPPLVMVRGDQARLDHRLERAGYGQVDPTLLYAAPTAALLADPPPVTVFTTDWPPLHILREVWQAGGIGPARLAVMERAKGPKTVLMGRVHDRPGAAAFLAIHDNVAMIHAVEVMAERRRSGLARHMMGVAATWAQDHGAGALALAVTRGNAPANSLYSSLKMSVVGQYAYRLKV
jgi:GNAT superfamily N-acetyltransferase